MLIAISLVYGDLTGVRVREREGGLGTEGMRRRDIEMIRRSLYLPLPPKSVMRICIFKRPKSPLVGPNNDIKSSNITFLCLTK